MSEFTTNDILKMIDEAGTPEVLDLSLRDLRGIDLGIQTVAPKAQYYREVKGRNPVWLDPETGGFNLQGMHLELTDMREAKLHSANLQEAKFWNADLQGAILDQSNLQEAKLQEVNLQGASLRGVNLQRSILDESKLQGAVLSESNMQKARLHKTNLQQADLRKADLQRALLIGANLQGTILSEANLQGASLREASLQGAELHDANLQAASLRETNLQHVDLRHVASLQGAYFANAHLDTTLISRQKLGKGTGEEADKKWQQAEHAYRGLKENWRSQKAYSDARWAGVRQNEMKRKARQQRLRENVFSAFLPVISSWFWRLSSNHAASPLLVLLWVMVFALGIFPLLFWYLQAVVPGSDTMILQYWDYLLFSLNSAVMTTYLDLSPSGTTGNYLIFVERAVGIGSLTLFIYTLGRRVVGY